jgi:predicted Rossmann fold nucleotide-binding protein DprA/Smf involved in DNA uptake
MTLPFDGDICASNHGGDEFSGAAHDSIAESKAAMWGRIVRFLSTQPATCCEVENALGMRHQTASARLSELKRDGRVFRTGERRKTDSGRYAAVLAAVQP